MACGPPLWATRLSLLKRPTKISWSVPWTVSMLSPLLSSRRCSSSHTHLVLRLAVSDQTCKLAPALGSMEHRRHVYSYLLHGTARGATCVCERMNSVFYAVASGGSCDCAGPEQQDQRAYTFPPSTMQTYDMLRSVHSEEVRQPPQRASVTRSAV